LLVIAVKRRQPTQAGGFEVLARDDRFDTRHFHGLADVDALDGRMGIRTADDRSVEHAGHRDVVHVAPLALEEAGIFLPLHAVPQRVTFFLRLYAHVSPHLATGSA
jgi:hypothetical protein